MKISNTKPELESLDKAKTVHFDSIAQLPKEFFETQTFKRQDGDRAYDKESDRNQETQIQNSQTGID